MTDKKITRSRENRVLAGVCGGLAEYLGIDTTLVRIATVALSMLSIGTVACVYIIACFVLPEDDTQNTNGTTYSQ